MNPVEIYTSLFCNTCDRAKELLTRKGVAYTEFEVSTNAIKLREMMARSGGRKAVPQIFIGGAHVGGLAELTALERSGGLDSLLGGKDR